MGRNTGILLAMKEEKKRPPEGRRLAPDWHTPGVSSDPDPTCLSPEFLLPSHNHWTHVALRELAVLSGTITNSSGGCQP